MNVRAYHCGDLHRLHEIDTLCFPKGIAYSRRGLKIYIDLEGAFTLVAEDPTGAIMGFILARKERRPWGHIITIDVLPEYRKQSVGSRLLAAAEARLWAAGVSTIYLETAIDNTTAIRFYEKFGYRITRRIPRYYQGKLDAYLMCKAKAE